MRAISGSARGRLPEAARPRTSEQDRGQARCGRIGYSGQPDGHRRADRMIIGRIKAMLERCEAGSPAFPPTALFGEQWLLRVVVDWFDGHGGDRYPLSPCRGARWFSEAWLPSAFLPRYRGDRLGESRTHADAVIGHFRIGDPGSSGLALAPEARQLVLLEAKLFNRLSPGIKNAPGFDQAARSVACLAEVLRRADRDPSKLDDLAFLILAPRARIDDGVFARGHRARVDPPEGPPPGRGLRRRARRLAPRLVRADPRAGRRPLPGLGGRDRDHRLPRPRGRPAHRQLLRQVPPLQPPPPASRLPRPPRRRQPPLDLPREPRPPPSPPSPAGSSPPRLEPSTRRESACLEARPPGSRPSP